MLHFILMLFGFVFPGSEANMPANDKGQMTTDYVQTANSDAGEDTGGEIGNNPPKK